MILCTLAAGGYRILRALEPGRRWLPRVLGSILLVLGSFSSSGLAALATLFLAVVALYRSGQLVAWAFKSRLPPEQRAPHLLGASWPRLATFAALNALQALFIVGIPLAFAEWWPRESAAEQAVLERTAWEMALRRSDEGRALLAARADTIDPQEELMEGPRPPTPPPQRHFEMRIKDAGDPSRFIVEAWPRRFPFPPYHLLTSLPAWYADERGLVRMTRVRSARSRCPADAPVISEIGEAEIREMMSRLGGGADLPQ